MGALLDDVPVLHDQNHIGIANGGQPVGNDKTGSALHEVIHCLLNQNFCTGIHRGGRLVQNHDPIVRQNGTGNGEQLFLSL